MPGSKVHTRCMNAAYPVDPDRWRIEDLLRKSRLEKAATPCGDLADTDLLRLWRDLHLAVGVPRGAGWLEDRIPDVGSVR